MEKILVLGVGPGAPEYLTQKTRELAESCYVLIGGERNLSMFQEFALEKIPLTGSLETWIPAEIIPMLAQQLLVTRRDPFVS